jgi:hypothetical protein
LTRSRKPSRRTRASRLQCSISALSHRQFLLRKTHSDRSRRLRNCRRVVRSVTRRTRPRPRLLRLPTRQTRRNPMPQRYSLQGPNRTSRGRSSLTRVPYRRTPTRRVAIWPSSRRFCRGKKSVLLGHPCRTTQLTGLIPLGIDSRPQPRLPSRTPLAMRSRTQPQMWLLILVKTRSPVLSRSRMLGAHFQVLPHALF